MPFEARRAVTRGRARVVLACALACMLAVASSHGATSGSVVAANVPSATTLSTTGCPPNTVGITNFGSVTPGSTVKTSADCDVTFGSSNDSSSLRMTQSDGGGSAMGHPTDAWTRHTGSSSKFGQVDGAGNTIWATRSTGTLQRSQTNGTSWTASIGGFGGNHGSISVPTQSTGWMTGDGSANVWRTTNGDVASPTWAITAASPCPVPKSVAGISGLSATVVCNGGLIRSTGDGGGTWANEPSGTASNLGGVVSLDADSFLAWGSAGKIVAKQNGAAWRDISVPVAMNINDIFPITDDVLVVVGDGGYIYTTANATNATPTWTARASGTAREIGDVEFLDANNGLAIGDFGIMLTTSDGGATWTLGDTDASHRLTSMTVAGNGNLVAVGGGLHALYSADGGANWSMGQDPTNESWRGVSMTLERVGWRVGSDGLVEKSTTGGTSWVSQTSNTGADLMSVYAFDTLHATAVGRGGVIVTTSNGGTSWTVRTSGTTANLWMVDGPDTDGRAWAVGENGTILRSADFGDTWTVQESGSGASLYDVATFSSSTVVAVGRAGVARRTTDGGQTWSALVLPTGSSHVRDVAGLPGTGVGVYTANGGFWRTTDSGATWAARAPVGTYSSSSIDLATPDVVFAVGYGTARMSTDGGLTFPAMVGNQVTYHDLYSVVAVDRLTAVVVGDGGVSGTTGSSSDIDNYVQNTSDWIGDGTEAFGACLRATTGTPTWTVNATCDQTVDGAHWKAIPTLADTTAEVASTAAGDGNRTASFRFGLRVAPNEPPGELTAGITFVVVAPDV